MNMPDIAGLLEKLPLVKAWIRQRRLARMHKALLALSPLHRNVFRMIRLEGLSVELAARNLHMPLRQVEKLLTEVIVALAEADRW